MAIVQACRHVDAAIPQADLDTPPGNGCTMTSCSSVTIGTANRSGKSTNGSWPHTACGWSTCRIRAASPSTMLRPVATTRAAG
jgi:hypothetical protein